MPYIGSLISKERCIVSKALRIGWITSCAIVAFLAACIVPLAQGPADNPYRPVRGLADGGGPSVPGGEWARLPGGREMGPPASVHIDADGESIWAFIRCDETSPVPVARGGRFGDRHGAGLIASNRSEEHTSELQSQSNLVCRLLLEKKKITFTSYIFGIY